MNEDIKSAAKEAGVPLFRVGYEMGISESALSRKLRGQLNDKEKEAIVNHQGKVEGYEYSSFGYLEKRLNDKNLFPLYPIEDR